jgi:tetratricopeptide (TPR) repeat protein
LETLARELKTFGPQLVFLSGHGQYRREPLDQAPGQGIFVFEGPDGESDPRDESEIAQAFLGTRVQCLVLSACESGKSASDDLNSGLARRLALAGVPHVIGMRESILDPAAIAFARAFCDSVAGRERIDRAMQSARSAIARPLSGQTWREPQTGTDTGADTGTDAGPGTAGILASLSLGQWCLPMQLCLEPGRPLIDWTFEPKPPVGRLPGRALASVTLPARFVGRRRELRALQGDLAARRRRRLLVTGPGGQGKTALAGTLAADLGRAGWTVFAWSARPGHRWSDFKLDLMIGLGAERIQCYNLLADQCPDETARARVLLKLLLEQHGGRVLLFLDNLESMQDPETLALRLPLPPGEGRGAGTRAPDADRATVSAWIDAALGLLDDGLTLILTSRWRLPDWPERDHWPLDHATLGDFIRQAQELRLPVDFYRRPDRLRRAWRVLHGNPRGLEFFAAAIRDLRDPEEDAFLDRLAQASAELQTDMALELVLAHRSDAERALLRRLPAFRTPVPIEGIVRIGLDLPEPRRLLDGLLAVSLVERRYAPDLLAPEYQCPATVADWLGRVAGLGLETEWLGAAADFQLYLFRTARPTLDQAVAVHEVLRAAGRRDEADRWVLDRIVEPMDLAGLYASLLKDWLPAVCESAVPEIRANALNLTGLQFWHIGDYRTALGCYQDALAIRQEIGDRAGQGQTLNNIAIIHQGRGDHDRALDLLQRALAIRQEIGDHAADGTTLNNIGETYRARGELDLALDLLQRALAISQEIGDRAGEGTTLNNISQIHWARGELESALGLLQRALAISREIGDRAGEGTKLNNIAQIHKTRGELDRALDLLQRSLAIQQAIGDRVGEAATLNNMAGIHQDRSEPDLALGLLQHALAIAREIGDRADEGLALNNIATIHQARGDLDLALDLLQRALAIRQEIGDRAGEGQSLNNLSQIHQARGELDPALDLLQRSLAISQEIGNRADEGAALNNIAAIHRHRGELDLALELFQRSLVICQEIGNRAGQGHTLSNISQIHEARGDLDQALDLLQRSLAIRQEIGDRAGEAQSLNNLAQIHQARGELDLALDLLLRSLAISREIGDRAGEGQSLNNLAHIHRARGELDPALELLQRSLIIQQEIGNAAGLCATLFNIGHIQWQQGEHQAALKSWTSVYRQVRSIGLAEGLQNLELLAPRIGLRNGLTDWDTLARQLESGGQVEPS